MSKITVAAQIDTESFFSALTELKVNELEVFVKRLNGLILRKKEQDKDYQISNLLLKINNTVLERGKRERYIELSEKVEDETVTPSEHKELLVLAEEEEHITAQRLKLLLELSQLRNIPLSQLMREMGLVPKGHG